MADKKDWWVNSLEANTPARQRAHRDFQSLAVETTLCDICKTIDFGYLFFGDLATGFRKNHEEVLCLGSVASVKQRASQGCCFCRDIATPQADALLDVHYEQLVEEKSPTDFDRIAVYVRAHDIMFSRDAPDPHRSNGLYISVAIQEEPVVYNATPDIREEGEEEVKIHSKHPAVCLLDHELSVYKRLQPLINLERCRQWLRACCDTHGQCKEPETSTFSNPRFKLIDVRTRQIVQIGFTPGLKYATLSYVWGPVANMWMLKNPASWVRNEQGLLQCALPETLPQTLEDAIRVTAGLDLRYLWIDAVCIIQNDLEDKMAQIGAMYNIYSEAQINIIAASGENPQAGLPGVSLPRSVPGSAGAAIRDGVYVGVPRPPLHEILKSYVWLTRAWTYQEVILSRRSLFFTDTEAFFFCGTITSREAEIEWKTHGSWGQGDAYAIGNSSIMQATGATGSPREMAEMYRAAVVEYTGRQLTYQTDGLNAFHGISTLIGQLFKCDMISACPRKIIVNCLTWSPPVTYWEPWPQRRMVRDKPDGSDDGHLVPLLPSWAWVAWKCVVSMSLTSYYFWGSEMKVLNAQCFSPIPMTPSLQYAFAVTKREDDDAEFIDGILPVVTKMARFQIVGLELEGYADILTPDGQRVGDCDVRGFLDIQEDQKQEATFLQVWITQEKGRGTNCNTLLVRLHELPDSMAQKLGTQCSTASPPCPATVQRKMSMDDRFRKRMEGDCPPSLAVRDSVEGFVPEQVYLATRIGVGRINFDGWMKGQPEDALVFLG